jgi:uncharacterized protein
MPVRLEFDWDPAKALLNASKHDVSFDDAMTVFRDPLALSRPDDDSAGEQRWITIGLSHATKLLLVVHTYVELSADHTYIRIISSRKPNKREKRQYEQTTDET